MRHDLQTADDATAPDLRMPEPSPEAGSRRSLGIRQKIFGLVLLSALVPAAIVGMVSYFVARGFLTEKVQGQLEARLSAAKADVARALEERVTDTEIFASALVVSRGLEPGSQASLEESNARQRAVADLQRYLDEVAERYPLYRKLQVLDGDGRVVAASPASASRDSAGATGAQGPASSGVQLDRIRGIVLVEVSRPVTSPSRQVVGALITASRLDDLWDTLQNGMEDSAGRLLLVSNDGLRLFESWGRMAERPDSDPRPAAAGPSKVVAGDPEALPTVIEHIDAEGRRLVTAFDRLPEYDLGISLETDADVAFAAVSGLRTVVLLIGFGAAVLVAALGALLAAHLTRPIDALIAGARVAAEGDLSTQIPVSASDEIGELTATFNLMIRSLRHSQERLEILSVTDELTGLYNRRYLTRAIDRELKQAKRSGRPFAVIMIDLDRFKEFNDRRGHPEGDAFLRVAAGILESELRPNDVVARYGGEEFVVLLPEAGKAQAGAIAERVRLRFEDQTQAADDAPQVTISAGVAAHPEDGVTRTELIVNADRALYQAKRLGRNRVELCRAA